MKAIRIFLLILIVVGVVLLLTQKFWIPRLVEHILQNEASTFLPIQPPVSSSTSVARPGKVDSGVEGIVTIGPTCPVERIPPDPKCANKPYPTTLVIVNNYVNKNEKITVSTDGQGYFSKELIPGTYTISAEQLSIMPALSPVTFKVALHSRTSLNLQFDSGIR